MATIYAVHFLDPDMRSRLGDEEPWKVGETRRIKNAHALRLCKRGYHYAPTWKAALLGGLLFGPKACIVEVDDSGPKDEHKGVSSVRTLVECFDVEQTMRLYAADEAARALQAWEKRTGRRADERAWTAVEAARGHATGTVTDSQLAAARDAAYDAAWAVAWGEAWALAGHAAASSAWDAALDAAWASAWAAAGYAVRDTPKAAAGAAALNAARNAGAERFAAAMHKATGWRDADGTVTRDEGDAEDARQAAKG
jgi:hypothetical protein